MRILRTRDSGDLSKETALLKSRGEIETRSLQAQMQASFTSCSVPTVGQGTQVTSKGEGSMELSSCPQKQPTQAGYFALLGALNPPDTAHVLTCPLWPLFPGLWFWTQLTQLEMWLVEIHRGGSCWHRRLQSGSSIRAVRTWMGRQWGPGRCRWERLISSCDLILMACWENNF